MSIQQLLQLLLFLGVCLISKSHSLSAQSIHQDCINAIPICLSGYSETNAYQGDGFIPNEIGGTSCLGTGERNCVWYTFTTQMSGELCFSITPNTNTDDYDWAVYDLTNNQCEDIFNNGSLELGCNYSPDWGVTGPNGLGGNQNEPCITVVEDGTYVINVSQFEEFSQDGYSIDFSQSTVDIFDEDPPQIVGYSANPNMFEDVECGDFVVYLQFNEFILCDSLNAEDIVLTGPNGTSFVCTEVFGQDCEDASGATEITRSKNYVFTFDPPFTSSGFYTLEIISTADSPSIVDLCANTLTEDSPDAFNLEYVFVIPDIPFEGDIDNLYQCDALFPTNLELENTVSSSTYNWYDENGVVLGNEINTGESFDVTDILVPGVPQTFFITETKITNCVSVPIMVTAETYAPPTPVFDYTVDCETFEVQFNNQTVFDNAIPGIAPKVFWNFGDPDNPGQGSTLDNPTYTYPQTGTYTVMLSAEYAPGCKRDTSFVDITVVANPTVDFVATTAVCKRVDTEVGGTTLYDTYTWDWGDGTVETLGANASHIYADDGLYDISLTVSKYFSEIDCDLTADGIQSVDVSDAGVSGSFDVLGNGCAPMSLDVNSTSIADEYIWNWGDGSPTETGQNSTHLYQAAGNYEVTLVINVNNPDCVISDTIAQNVNVKSIPVVEDIILSNENAFVGEEITATYTTTENGITNQNWDFGDGALSTDSIAQHSFEMVGNYSVCVTIDTDEPGCLSEPLCKTVTLGSKLWADVPSAFSPNGDGLNDVLYLEGDGVDVLDFKIFNRWGEMVFQSTDFETGWDGFYNDKTQEIDVFLYTLEVQFVDGSIANKQGNISLIR